MEFSRQEYWSGLPFPSPGLCQWLQGKFLSLQPGPQSSTLDRSKQILLSPPSLFFTLRQEPPSQNRNEITSTSIIKSFTGFLPHWGQRQSSFPGPLWSLLDPAESFSTLFPLPPTTSLDTSPPTSSFHNICLFIWLWQVLVAAKGTFDRLCNMQDLYLWHANS